MYGWLRIACVLLTVLLGISLWLVLLGFMVLGGVPEDDVEFFVWPALAATLVTALMTATFWLPRWLNLVVPVLLTFALFVALVEGEPELGMFIVVPVGIIAIAIYRDMRQEKRDSVPWTAKWDWSTLPKLGEVEPGKPAPSANDRRVNLSRAPRRTERPRVIHRSRGSKRST